MPAHEYQQLYAEIFKRFGTRALCHLSQKISPTIEEACIVVKALCLHGGNPEKKFAANLEHACQQFIHDQNKVSDMNKK